MRFRKSLKSLGLSGGGASFPCLVCGVDSGDVLRLFLFFVGAGVLGSVCVLIWGVLTKKFAMNNDAALLPLQAENEEDYDRRN